MKINIIGKCNKEVKSTIKQGVLNTFKFVGCPDNIEVSIKLVDSKQIHALNKALRKVDKATDVLSFPSLNIKAGEKIVSSLTQKSSFDGENIYLGDCALCLEIAQMQANDYGKTLNSEVNKLVVHSMLHLIGYDHIKDSDFLVMHKFEKLITGEEDE